ncbi:cell division protein FtsA [Fidelibacter multiformis]|jgi:cell division protein FtsA|uniref:cell division protein FtsA n=1 Tax=Fidelibacter multiformis TaxID=3377529 RepID=UPI0037DDB7EA
MSHPIITTGLDIGTTKICAMIGQYDPEEKKYQILGMGQSLSHGLKRGVVIDIEETKQSIIKALAEAEKHSGITISSVSIGIAGDHIRSLDSTSTVAISHKNSGPDTSSPVDQHDINRALDSVKNINLGVDREIIHVIPQEYVVDDQMGVKNPIQMSGSRLTVNAHIVTAAINNVKNLVRSVQSTGLNVENIVLEPLASSRAILSEDQKDLGVALVDIGGGTTDITVFKNGFVKHTGVIGYGGSIVTKDIASIIQTSFQEAERIKKSYAWASSELSEKAGIEELTVASLSDNREIRLNSFQLSQYVEARIEEILLMVREKICQFTDIKSLHAGIVFTGGGARLKGLCQVSEKIFHVPAQIGYPIRMPGLENTEYGPEYSTAIGLMHWSDKNKKELIPTGRDSDSTVWGKLKKLFSDIAKNLF